MPTAPAFPEAAHDILVAKVHAPIFFEKLASDYGLVAKSAAEQRSLLEAAGILRAEKAQRQTKQASSGGFVVEAVDCLKQVLHEQGRSTGLPTSLDQQVKTAAANVVNTNAEVAKASLAYYEYLTQLQAAAQ